jgi:hypothetical protein
MVGNIPFFQSRKDAVRGAGGLVSIEELNARGKDPIGSSGSVKKVLLSPIDHPKLIRQKKPALSFSRRSLRLSRSRDSAPLSPSLNSPPPFESPHNRFPVGDPRKQSPVSDARSASPAWQQLDAPGLTRRRSKTADGSADPRPRAPSSHGSSRESKSSYSSANTRPRTSSGTESSTSHTKDSLKAYSLVPSIDTAVPRVPQQKSPMGPGASPASFTRFHLPGAPHSYPNSPRNSTPGTPLPAIRSSILDEVEGTLTATITELQELQSVWHHDSPPVTPEHGFGNAPGFLGAEPSRPSTSRASSRDRGSVQPVDSYFQQTDPTQSSPLKSVASADSDPQMLALQAAYDEQRKLVRTLTMENDGNKRRLVFVGARLNEFATEKSALARAAKDARDNLQVTLLKLREAKDSELSAQQEIQSARNAMSIMETRYDEEKKRHGLTREELEETTQRLNAKLEEVNTHKVDLLEKELESRRDQISTKKKLKKAIDELNAVRRKEQSAKAKAESAAEKLRESLKRNDALQGELRKLSPQSDLPSRIADMAFQLEDMQAQLEAKDDTLASLTAQAEQAAALTASLEDQNRELAEQLDQRSPTAASSSAETVRDDSGLRERLEAALVERDKYAMLLHAEIRRTVVDDHGRNHPSMPFLKKKIELDDAVRLVRERAKAFLSKADGGADDGAEEADEERLRGKVADLEKEIDYYLNDIVLYKLDVKGYRKDLRKAEQRLRDMSEVQRQDEAARPEA